jgi:hypothetical protein
VDGVGQTHKIPPLADVAEPALARLAELQALEADWDTYGGFPPTLSAVTRAETLIRKMASRAGSPGVPHEVMPIADGGISLEWRYPSLELGLNACPDDGWSYLLVERDASGRRYTEKYDLSDDDALALVTRIVATVQR